MESVFCDGTFIDDHIHGKGSAQEPNKSLHISSNTHAPFSLIP